MACGSRVMVVIDAQQDLYEGLRIDAADRDRLKRTRGGVPIGAVVSRGALIELALIASDNQAAAALARHYPQGIDGFQAAIQRKMATLGLANTLIEAPTGLSPKNRSSARANRRAHGGHVAILLGFPTGIALDSSSGAVLRATPSPCRTATSCVSLAPRNLTSKGSVAADK